MWDLVGEARWLSAAIGTTGMVALGYLGVLRVGARCQDRCWRAALPLLARRGQLIRSVGECLDRCSSAGGNLTRDLDGLLTNISTAEDWWEQAAWHNGLALIVLRSLYEYQGNEKFRSDPMIFDALGLVGAIDSRIAPLRDHLNKIVRRHNACLAVPALSVVARLIGEKQRPIFPLFIPWWSLNDSAYRGTSFEEMKHIWEMAKAPIATTPHELSAERAALRSSQTPEKAGRKKAR